MKEKRRKGRKEGKGEVGRLDLAGGSRSWPEKMANAPNPRNLEGVSVVQKGKMEFCK